MGGVLGRGFEVKHVSNFNKRLNHIFGWLFCCLLTTPHSNFNYNIYDLLCYMLHGAQNIIIIIINVKLLFVWFRVGCWLLVQSMSIPSMSIVSMHFAYKTCKHFKLQYWNSGNENSMKMATNSTYQHNISWAYDY